MRISGGIARGIPILAPRGSATRPAADRTRETLFAALGERIVGARVADLYAGSGSYGLEAMSRGASRVVFVECSARCVECIRGNVEAALKSMRSGGMTDLPEVRIERATVASWLRRVSALDADWFFADPPYADFQVESTLLLERLLSAACGEQGGLVLEGPAGMEAPIRAGWTVTRQWQLGGTALWMLKRTGAG